MSEANTFSIVARCPRTGELGVAVATAVPAVGSMCPYIRSGVAATSTQSWVNPYLALSALAQVEAGHGAERALALALAAVDAADLRQIGLVDAGAERAAHTGAQCNPGCGPVLSPAPPIHGNLLPRPPFL